MLHVTSGPGRNCCVWRPLDITNHVAGGAPPTPGFYFCWEFALLANISNVSNEKHFKCGGETNIGLWPKCSCKCFLRCGGGGESRGVGRGRGQIFTNHLCMKTAMICFRKSCLGEKSPNATKCSQDVTKKMPTCSLLFHVTVQTWSEISEASIPILALPLPN